MIKLQGFQRHLNKVNQSFQFEIRDIWMRNKTKTVPRNITETGFEERYNKPNQNVFSYRGYDSMLAQMIFLKGQA